MKLVMKLNKYNELREKENSKREGADYGVQHLLRNQFDKLLIKTIRGRILISLLIYAIKYPSG